MSLVHKVVTPSRTRIIERVAFDVEPTADFVDVCTWLDRVYPDNWHWHTLVYERGRRKKWWQFGPWRPIKLTQGVVELGNPRSVAIPYTTIVRD